VLVSVHDFPLREGKCLSTIEGGCFILRSVVKIAWVSFSLLLPAQDPGLESAGADTTVTKSGI
jgi:hypothetical protein